VTASFAEEGTATRLTLCQEGFVTAALRHGHGRGWSSALDSCRFYLDSPQDAPADFFEGERKQFNFL